MNFNPNPRSDMAAPLLAGGGLFYIQSHYPLQDFVPPDFKGYVILGVYAIYILAVVGIIRIVFREVKDAIREIRAHMPSDAYGSAGFMSASDASGAKMYRRGVHFLGVLHGKIAWADPPAHVLIIAPTRAGKTTAGILPQLGLNKRSAIVTDIKGELFQQTAKYRARNFGHTIVELNLPDRVAQNPASYNVCQIVLDSLRDKPELAMSDAWAIANQLYPEPKGGHRDPYWPYGSKGVLACTILGLAVVEPAQCNLVEVRKLVTDRLAFVALCEALQDHDALGGDLAVLAQSFISMEQKTPKELQSFVNGAAQTVSIFTESGRIGAISKSCSFRFRDTKRRPTTIYMGADDTNKDEIFKVAGLWNWAACTEIIREGTAKPVYIYADEAARYKIANLPDILEGSTGLGLRFILVYQSFASMEEIYGREGASRIIGMSSTQQIFGLNDNDEAYRVSQALGKQTDKVSTFGVTGQVSENVSMHGRELMSADEVRRMDKNHMIVLTSGERPAVVTKVSSHEIYPMALGFAPNRLYGRWKRLGAARVITFPRIIGRFFPGLAYAKNEYKVKRPGLPWLIIIAVFIGSIIDMFRGSKPVPMIALVLFVCYVTAGLPYIRYDVNARECSYAGIGVMHRSQPDCPLVRFEPLPEDGQWLDGEWAYKTKRSIEQLWY